MKPGHLLVHKLGVAWRADPVRIFQASRIAVRNGQTDYGVSVEDAEPWCDAFGLEAANRWPLRDGDSWQLGQEWIAGERAAGRSGLGHEQPVPGPVRDRQAQRDIVR